MPFKPGQSGNPAGRKAKTEAEREIEQLARKHGPAAIKRLREWMDSDNAKASTAAATALLNRGYGMPKQQHDVQVGANERLLNLIEAGLERAAQR